MTTLLTDPAISAALWLTVKATLLLGGAALLERGLHRRTSAATRHMIWALAIAGVLVLPALSLVLPAWPVPVHLSQTGTPAACPYRDPCGATEPIDGAVPPAGTPAPLYTSGATGSTAQGARLPWPAAIALIYAAGVIAVLLRLALDRRGLRRLVREATDVRDADWIRLMADCAASLGVDRPVRLLRTRTKSLPMAVGTRRQAIVIPATADTWSDDRRRAVLLHEMAHVGRYDCLTQMVAFAACALYWFHPAAWWVARRLRIERELACDDCAIAAGTQARDYAGHLLEIAYSCSGDRAPALAVSMARPRQLEGRMLAALDAARNRRGPTARGRAAGAAVAATALLALASATPTATATEKTPALPTSAAEDQNLMAIRDAAWNREAKGTIARDVAAALQERQPGTWEIRPSKTEGTLHLRLVELNSSSGTDVPIARLEGLTAAHLTSAGGPVQFRIRRDAGTFTFEGVIRSGVGAGTFTFAPDATFPAALAKRGFAQPTAEEQYQMARHDIGFAFIDELTKQGYTKPAIADLVRAGQHGVNDVYVREMAAVGYRLGTLAPLVELRDHGVTPTYVRELADLGYKGLTPDGIRKARDHGISPDYVRGMRDEGYGSLPMDQLIQARDHGVDAAFARGLGAAGYSKLPIDELIRVRDHGVSPEYARGMRDLGHDLPIAELVRARDHGVDVQYAKAMAALGHAALRLDALVRLRDHGVTPDYVEGLKALGYDQLSADELVSLRDHGLTPDRIKAANARAGSRLSVDALKSATRDRRN